jgi:hypothetical protein
MRNHNTATWLVVLSVLLSLTAPAAFAAGAAPKAATPAAPASPAAPATKAPAAMADLEVKIVNVTSPAAPGGTVMVAAKTAANANCSISVVLKSGASTNKALAAKKATPKGDVSWSWTLAANTAPGKVPVTVSCKSMGKEAKAEGEFEVKGKK